MPKLPSLFTTLNYSMDSSTSRRRLFVPTFGSFEAVAFWLGLVLFLSLYGILVQFDHITSLQHFGVLFFDFFFIQFLVIFSIIGYTHLSIASYQSLTIFQQSKRIALTTLILAPIMTLLGKFIEISLGFPELVTGNIFIEALVNTSLGLVLGSLLLYYFSWQYAKILQSQQRYHQKLLNQNAQLKARITPHFFFNMLNTLQYLTETNPAKSNELLAHIAKLYRVSFAEPADIGFNEEITLCEHYLAIEQYRFGDKLQVKWQLPDEDSLYDMSIPSLMLQNTLEKLILAFVETTIQPILLSIDVLWEQDWVTVTVTAESPTGVALTSDLHATTSILDFSQPRVMLQHFYGKTAKIHSNVSAETSVPKYVIQICYPLKEGVL